VSRPAGSEYPAAVPHDIRATYSSLARARHALQLLERKGVDASLISLEGPGADLARVPTTNVEQRSDDQALVSRVGGRAIVGLLVGALIGALICVVIAVVADITMAVVIAGVIVGGLLGFLWSGYSGLSVSEAWSDTYAGPDEGEGVSTTVVIQADDRADELVEALRGTDPVDIAVS
jgi:hypothetical protein